MLRDEIVPNVVKNLLANYPAFSGLQKSSVGIGLRLYNDNSSKTLAFLSNEVSRDLSSVRAYGLNVNLNCLRKMADDGAVRAELEAAVTREITRAFLYETARSGMLGVNGSAASGAAGRFSEWFIEGMTLTASGAGEWLGYMGLDSGSDAGQIAAVLKNPAARLDSGSPLSVNGTGYLACMYLGAMAGGVCGKVDSNAGEDVISRGLSNLLAMSASEKQLDDAVRDLSLGRFTGAADFCEKFSTDDEVIGEAATFISGLLKKKGSGRGGLATGDLSETDLAADTNGGYTSLFRLNTSQGVVRNTGGTGIKPYTPVRSGYGDLFVAGVERASDIEYNETDHTLTIRGGENIELSMKSGVTRSALNKIVVEGAARVTLNGVKLTNASALTIKNDAEIVYSGYNELGGVNLTENHGVEFLGTGQLQIGTFTTGSTDNRVRFAGGAVRVKQLIGKKNSVIIDDAMVGGIYQAVNSEGKELTNSPQLIDQDIYSIREITSVELDGKRIDLLLKRDELIDFRLWHEKLEREVDEKTVNHLTVRSSGGAVQHLEAKMCTVTDKLGNKFEVKDWAPLTDGLDAFKVTGGVKGTDYTLSTDGTLTILTGARMTISGGKGLARGNSQNGTLGKEIYGKIRVADNIGSVNLVLADVVCDHVSNDVALDLGKNNEVNLTLAAGSTNVFQGSGDYNHAGIALRTGTNLTIDSAGGVGSTDGKLVAGGTRGAAGIGSNGTGTFQRGSLNIATTSCGSITINGGTIEATGGTDGGAGIGGGNYGSCGKITINGGNITATGQKHGAGIGGGWYDKDHRSYGNGAITITGGNITAICKEHGTGIGAGCMGTSGAITITGDAVIEQAVGGICAAGIGASASGRCASISILGNATVKNAVGGSNGAGIGAGAKEPNAYGSSVGEIVINTTGAVVATGGNGGVGIGCGFSAAGALSESNGLSSCGDIQILGGVVDAAGGVNSTGIGAGRGSVSGGITIGDESGSNMVVVTAAGGMSFNGGNILSYTDGSHTTAGELRIVGENTTVRAGYLGEGRYSTSGAVNRGGTPVFAYPLYLLVSSLLLPAGDGLENFPLTEDADRNSIRITAVGKSDGTRFSWMPGLSHAPLENGYDFIWMTGQDQELTVEYNTASGGKKSYTLELFFDGPTGIFRTRKQETPDELAQVPDYYPVNTKPEQKFYLPKDTFDVSQDPFPSGKPDAPVPIPGGSNPNPPDPSRPDPPVPPGPDPSRDPGSVHPGCREKSAGESFYRSGQAPKKRWQFHAFIFLWKLWKWGRSIFLPRKMPGMLSWPFRARSKGFPLSGVAMEPMPTGWNTISAAWRWRGRTFRPRRAAFVTRIWPKRARIRSSVRSVPRAPRPCCLNVICRPDGSWGCFGNGFRHHFSGIFFSQNRLTNPSIDGIISWCVLGG